MAKWKRPRLRNVAYHDAEIDERCEAANINGLRCHNDAVPGWNICLRHMTPAEKVKVAEAGDTVGQLAQIRKFLNPIPLTDPEANPLVAFSMEFRRSIGLIHFYEEQLNKLKDEREFVWGKVEAEKVRASEWQGLNEKWAARENIWLKLLNDERERMMRMEKIWLTANLGAQQLELQKRVVSSIDFAMQRVLQKLGVDIRDPKVRKLVRDELSGLGREE